MNGYQLKFFTQQANRHHGKPLAHWLVEQARALGIHGATLIGASEGFGHRGRIHSTHFIDLVDQPVEIVMAVTKNEAGRLFAVLREEKVKIVYVRAPSNSARSVGKSSPRCAACLARCETAIDGQHRADDETRLVRREVEHGRRDLLRTPQPIHRKP